MPHSLLSNMTYLILVFIILCTCCIKAIQHGVLLMHQVAICLQIGGNGNIRQIKLDMCQMVVNCIRNRPSGQSSTSVLTIQAGYQVTGDASTFSTPYGRPRIKFIRLCARWTGGLG